MACLHIAKGCIERRRRREDPRYHLRDPEARRRGVDHRLSGEPHPGAGCGGRHQADHRAPGAHRPAHGGRHLAGDERQEARRVLHAAWAGHRERLRRRRAGLQREHPDARHAHGLFAPAGLDSTQLQRQRQHGVDHQVGGAGDVGERNPRHPASRLLALEIGARRPGSGRGAGRCVCRGDRCPRLHAVPRRALRTGP